jgi:hypothetical protein
LICLLTLGLLAFVASAQSKSVNLTSSAQNTLTSSAQNTLRGSVPKQVFAFYYGWYNLSPDTWLNGRNGTNQPSVSGVPVLGFYNSGSASVIDTQINEAKSVGISGFIRSWAGNKMKFLNSGTQLLFQESF